VTTPGGSAPDGSFVLGSRFGQDVTETTLKNVLKLSVLPGFTKVQQSIASPVGNVIPTGSPLYETFTGDADATFPRILLQPVANGTDIGNNQLWKPPQYQPAGAGSNLAEIGFIETSKDRIYNTFTFVAGNAWTLLGVTAFYLEVYKMDLAAGNLTLVSRTNDIHSATGLGGTNQEYHFALNTPVSAKKSDIYGCATRQVTSLVQNCNSLCCLTFNPISAPAGFKPAALYAYGPAATTPPASIPYGSLTFNSGFVPYYALS
jgi:hypothetical protein